MIRLLREEKGWLAVDKPPRVPVIPGRGEDAGPSIRERLEGEVGQKLWVVHRLDRDTSGALLFAKDAATHRVLSMAFEAGRIRKVYGALVAGHLSEPQEIRLALTPARRGRMRPVKPGEEGKSAVTLVRPVVALRGATWLEAEPLTGRTHQIRVHLSAIGGPLWVDHQYGRPEPLLDSSGATILDRTPLHSLRIELPHLEGVPAAAIDAPLASDIEAAIALLR